MSCYGLTQFDILDPVELSGRWIRASGSLVLGEGLSTVPCPVMAMEDVRLPGGVEFAPESEVFVPLRQDDQVELLFVPRF